MRTFCVGTITVAMLAGSVVGVTGQSEPPGSLTASLEMQAIEGRHTATLLELTCLSAHEDMPDDAFKRFKVLPADASEGSTKPERPEDLAPSTPGPLPALGATVSGGRIEMSGSGFAITIPEKWVVKLVEPDPDIYAAAPGATWEALRAYEPGRRRACSVYVGVAPLDAGPVGEFPSVDTDGDATASYWSGSGKPTLVVPPARFKQKSRSSSEQVRGESRPRADDPRLPSDVVYAVACGADGERAPETADSFEILGSGQ